MRAWQANYFAMISSVEGNHSSIVARSGALPHLWWKNLSIKKKLNGLFGVMALLIAMELMAMLFVMDVLSSVRSFVGAEGLWSKSQKDAIQSLRKYAVSGKDRDFAEFQNFLQVNLGDRRARLELLKRDPDFDAVRSGLAKGKIDPGDMGGLIRLIRRFHGVSYIRQAIELWTTADMKIDDLIAAGSSIHALVLQGRAVHAQAISGLLNQADVLNQQFTELEDEFSATLGRGSRWLEGLLRYFLTFTVFTVECTGLLLTFTFTQGLVRNLGRLTDVVRKVGRGDFSQRIVVNSTDEIGNLSGAVNGMVQDLEKSIGDRQLAEAANDLKTSFLANISHEIRTPIWVILGMTEALKQDGLSESERLNFLQTIERTGNDLTRMVSDLLDISKIEAGHMELENNRFQLDEFLSELRLDLLSRAEKKKNSLIFVSSGGLPIELTTDRLRLRQILLNLLGNALKFTQNGVVRLSFHVSGDGITFRVGDNGIGISTAQRDRLFKPFSQVDSSTTRQYGGTGLGLFLSKKLASILGGDLVLERSGVGEGSVFRLTIKADISRVASQVPLAVKKSLPTENQRDLVGKTALVVDDSLDNQMLFDFYLKKWGLETSFAQNGQEGLEKALSQSFDVVLMDMQMPVVDGYEATRRLRSLGYAKPILAVTAHAMKQDRLKCLAVGCNEYISKPIHSEALHALLKDVCSGVLSGS